MNELRPQEEITKVIVSNVKFRFELEFTSLRTDFLEAQAHYIWRNYSWWQHAVKDNVVSSV